MGMFRKAASIMRRGGASDQARREPQAKAARAQAHAARAQAHAARAQAERAEVEEKVAQEQAAVLADAARQDEAHQEAELEKLAWKESEAVPWRRPPDA
jgi:hypothetical protein